MGCQISKKEKIKKKVNPEENEDVRRCLKDLGGKKRGPREMYSEDVRWLEGGLEGGGERGMDGRMGVCAVLCCVVLCCAMVL